MYRNIQIVLTSPNGREHNILAQLKCERSTENAS